jgi:serine/threonine protein kinase
MTDLIGSVIAHYRLDSLLGDGGMGSVYRAYDLNLDRSVAIKLMHAHFARRSEFRSRLTQEAKAAANLDHPSIVGIYEFGQSNGDLYLAMEYIGGGSLRAHLGHLQTEGRYLPYLQSMQIGAQISDALDFSHGKGVIHRDVKPSNIMLKRLDRSDESGGFAFRAVLTDFGLVKLLEGDSLTQTGMTMGTPTYMSPEQCEGLPLDGRSDIYSLGVVIYELVTNRLPFEFKSLSEAMAAHMRGQKPIPARQIRGDLPDYLDDLLNKALAKDPDDRFGSGQEMAEALRASRSGFSSSPTQVFESSEAPLATSMEQDVPDSGYRLRIEAPGQASSIAQMNQVVINIGRNPDNDIVLPTEGVSRRHAQFKWTSTGWIIHDLGGINGTKLDGSRLRSGEADVYQAGSTIEIGPYKLVLEFPEADVSPVAAGLLASQAVEPGDELQVDTNQIRVPLELYLAKDTISIDAGRETEIALEVVNRGDEDDRVSPRIHGLPTSWVTQPEIFIHVPAGETVSIPLVIHPPQHTESRAGRQRFRIELVSQRYSGMEPAISATLIIRAFESFEMTMEPRRIRLAGNIRVTLRNTGNAKNDFSVVGRNPAGKITIRGERGRITLEPGQTATVDLRLEERRRSIFGSRETTDFVIEVKTASGAHQSFRGKATTRPLLPTGVVYALALFLVFVCVLVALVLIFQNLRSGEGFGGFDFIGDSNSPAASAATLTSESAAPLSAQETSQAATAIASGDRDGDGLSDSQEQYYGTNLENPDTDQDLLSDSEELLILGTNPLLRDTDGDKLSDGEEVRSVRTDPTNPDSDGDGIVDGDEIIMGSDPLDDQDPPGVSTATSPPPSNTPAPSTPTNAVTPTPVDTHTAIPTTTPIPSDTPVPTSSATDSPTATSSPTNTPTQVSTTTPSLICVTTPPTIDGTVQVSEWGSAPLLELMPEGNGDRIAVIYAMRDAENLYLSSIMRDPTTNPTSDSIEIYFDANSNAGDPDFGDLLIQVMRDGTQLTWIGIGDNQDDNSWDPLFSSPEWRAVTAEPEGDRWAIEIEIELEEDLAQLVDGNSFASMFAVQYTGSEALWPEGALGNDAGTWGKFLNSSCQP